MAIAGLDGAIQVLRVASRSPFPVVINRCESWIIKKVEH